MIVKEYIENKIERGTIYHVDNPTLRNVYRVKIDWDGLYITEESYNHLSFTLKKKVIFSFLNENIRYTEDDKFGIGKLYESIITDLYETNSLSKILTRHQGEVKIKVNIIFYDEHGRRIDVILPRFGEIFELFEEGVVFLNNLLNS
jgi:hypothetical protein